VSSAGHESRLFRTKGCSDGIPLDEQMNLPRDEHEPIESSNFIRFLVIA
jgi:hypothetical protein